MQSLKDAAVVLGLLLFLVSVKVAPIEEIGDVIPSAEAAASEQDTGSELAGLPVKSLIPAMKLQKASNVEILKPELVDVRVDGDTHACESSIVHVQTIGLGSSGERIILRIDASQDQPKIERPEAPKPMPAADDLQACKIG